jgi:hypothetical protein
MKTGNQIKISANNTYMCMKHAERKRNGMRLKPKANAKNAIYTIRLIWIKYINWKAMMHE